MSAADILAGLVILGAFGVAIIALMFTSQISAGPTLMAFACFLAILAHILKSKP